MEFRFSSILAWYKRSNRLILGQNCSLNFGRIAKLKQLQKTTEIISHCVRHQIQFNKITSNVAYILSLRQ